VILIVSYPADDHAGRVLEELERAGHSALLVDTAQFPLRDSLAIAFEPGVAKYEITVDGRSVALDECRAGWWRRSQPFVLDPQIDPDVAAFTYSECHEAVAGLWAALGLKWINPPELDEHAHHKPYQLAAAVKVGLPIPQTLITNDPEAARKFISRLSPEHTVYKTFLASEAHWRETRILRNEELAILDRVRLAPVIFQEYVPATADIRATVVGDRIFAAAINAAPSGYQIDYRMDMSEAAFEPTKLTKETEEKILALMRALGLIYGAIDLRRTDKGDVFLEVNPAGEWLFVEERTGQPISRAMAELLAELDRK
jgi:glutathione synthase/RimK-type ligase-like ATP-grasp enzyme